MQALTNIQNRVDSLVGQGGSEMELGPVNELSTEEEAKSSATAAVDSISNTSSIGGFPS